jgi:GNAT superfamily N-acetyltransferase
VIALLPDEPRWVEVRSMLLSGRGHVFHVASLSPPSFVVLEPGTRTGAVVGGPSPAAIQEMASQADEILAEPERVDWVAHALRGWAYETATLYRLGPSPQLPRGRAHAVTAEEIEAWAEIPAHLRDELLIEARRGTAIYASFAGDRPAAFCYAGSITETLWDVSIDTLEPYRRRGYATQCVSYVIDRMRESGRQPVWGAYASNVASASLAQKLGFVPVDTVAVFTRPAESL